MAAHTKVTLMHAETMLAQRLELARARYGVAMGRVRECSQADDIAALAGRAKAAYAVVQELEDILFEYRGDCR